MALLTIRDLTVEYRRAGRVIRAADDVSFEIETGSVVGLVGESGSGKSTLALAMMGLLPRNGSVTAGSILFDGAEMTGLAETEWRSVRGRRMGMVFQGAMNSLNPVRRVIDQVAEPILTHEPDISKIDAAERAQELLALVGIPGDRHRAYPYEYSGGMRQRAGIAMALSGRPALLIADEPVTALDVIVQARILRLLENLREVLDLTILFITHDLGVVARLCDRVVVLYAARAVEEGTVEDIYDRPRHPYTRALLESVPNFARGRGKSHGIPGTPPSLVNPPSGCRFHPRCPEAMDICSSQAPAWSRFTGTQIATCHLYSDGGQADG
ncbi:MAG: ABC transporter ATP-binding protein [bacterium]|nr:ABC transporter ATP-binding protein [bacterium]